MGQVKHVGPIFSEGRIVGYMKNDAALEWRESTFQSSPAGEFSSTRNALTLPP
jgi:hypothetical protein